MGLKVVAVLRAAACTLICLALVFPPGAGAYAVLSHEAIIDSVWETHLKPLIRQRFPNATEEELNASQAYAYGGAIIQDMGYYPYGSHFFSDLTHYVRSADFVKALLADAQSADDYAFALGALAHFAADTDGHRLATNRAVPLLYPKLKKKYGDHVTYEDDPLAHVKTEFGFDVLEVAQERFAPDSYHDYVGFEVAETLLERAFCETYGLELRNVLVDEKKAFSSYRHAVSKTLPKATRIAWHLKRKEIQADEPSITKRKFLYNLSRSNYEHEWGKDYVKPTFGERFLALLYRILPKFGPLKVLQFKTPTPQTEQMFEESFNATLDRYRNFMTQMPKGKLELFNSNLDVGDESVPGKYRMCDIAYAQLLDKLAERHFASVSADLRNEILRFYSAPDAPYATKQDAKAWARVQSELQELKGVTAETQAEAPAVARQD